MPVLALCRETAGHTDMATHLTFISEWTHCCDSPQTQILEGWIWQQALFWGCCCQIVQVCMLLAMKSQLASAVWAPSFMCCYEIMHFFHRNFADSLAIIWFVLCDLQMISIYAALSPYILVSLKNQRLFININLLMVFLHCNILCFCSTPVFYHNSGCTSQVILEIYAVTSRNKKKI